MKSLYFLLAFASVFELSLSLLVKRMTTIESNHTLGYVGKFCYKYEHTNNWTTMGPVGSVEFKLLTMGVGDLYNISEYWFVMFDDDNWRTLRREKHATCSEQLKLANLKARLDRNTGSGMHYLKEHLFPRWWFAFILNCEHVTEKETMMYTAHFKQLHETSWSTELGANEKGLNTVYLFFTCFYFVLCIVQSAAYYIFKQDRQSVHQLVKLLTIAVFLQFFSVACHAVDMVNFSYSGEHVPLVVYVSYGFDALTLTCFTLILLLLAQGWTVTNQGIQRPRLLLAYSCFIFFYQVAFCVWRSLGFEEREDVKYFYDAPAMYFFGGVMGLSGCVFAVLCAMSYRKEEDDFKGKLYIFLGTVYTIWFFMPLIRIFLAHMIAEYARDIWVETVWASVQAVGFLIFAVLFWPKFASRYFRLASVHTATMMTGRPYEVHQNVENDDL